MLETPDRVVKKLAKEMSLDLIRIRLNQKLSKIELAISIIMN